MRLHVTQKSLQRWPVTFVGSLLLLSLLALAVGATRVSAGHAT